MRMRLMMQKQKRLMARLAKNKRPDDSGDKAAVE